MDKVILHCDMNGFFASVELLDRPELKNKPMAVCGNPDNRHGIILAKNEQAKKFGIKTAETLWQARKKCPGLVCVQPHHKKYKHYSRLINQIYYRYTDMVEPFSIDESWLDVTGSRKLFGTGREIADSIRKTVKEELGLTLSAGISWNKIFAKMGSEYKKPNASTEITRENYKSILWPMDIGEMFFVGAATADKLNKTGILTIGDMAEADRTVLTALLGKQGDMLWKYANGMDDSPVSLFSEKQKIKSVGNGITFRRNLISQSDISVAVKGISDTVAGRLRKYEMKAGGIKVEIKDTDLKKISRQKQLLHATNTAEEIAPAAIQIIKVSWPQNKPIRMLTVTGINLRSEDEAEQLSFWGRGESERQKGESLERTMDFIRSKYGDSSVVFGGTIGRSLGIDLDDTSVADEDDEENIF